MSPTRRFNVADEVEVAQALTSLDPLSGEQLALSIERDEKVKRYVRILR